MLIIIWNADGTLTISDGKSSVIISSENYQKCLMNLAFELKDAERTFEEYNEEY